MPQRVCPIWMGYLLANPLRKLLQNPFEILRPFVRPGMTVLDVGCAMGFFSLPMAELVGTSGKAVCVDMQEGMLRALRRRAQKAGVAECIEARRCTADSLMLDDLAGAVDFALAFAVVHEVPDDERLYRDLAAALKPSAKLLMAEPRGHVPFRNFKASVERAEKTGFRTADAPVIRGSHAALMSLQPAAR